MTQPENPPPVTLPLAMSFSGQGDQVASFLLVISLYLLRSNNSTMRTLQSKKHNNQTGSTVVLQTTLLPLLQVLNGLEVWVF